MCTMTREKPVLQIAEEDIEVYKLCIKEGGDIVSSYHFGKKYVKNELYYTDLSPFVSERGFYKSGAGFYSYQDPKYGNCKFIIPKGATYYLCKDRFNDSYIYHSDQIKFIGIYDEELSAYGNLLI